MKPYFAMPEDGWYNIAIAGEFPHATGYVQVLDSEAFKAIVQDVHEQMGKPNWPGILIDFDHGSLDTAKPSTAAGWLTDIEERPDGLWARIRWSDCGQKSLEGGEFRFVSPVWMLADCEELGEKRVRPKKIASCAITNAPNIRGMVPLTNRTEEKGVPLSPTGRALPIQERVEVPRAALDAIEKLENRVLTDKQRKLLWARNGQWYGGNGGSPYQNAAKAGREAAAKEGATPGDIIKAKKEARDQSKLMHDYLKRKANPEIRDKERQRRQEKTSVLPGKKIKRIKKATSGDVTWEKKDSGFKKYGRKLKRGRTLSTDPKTRSDSRADEALRRLGLLNRARLAAFLANTSWDDMTDTQRRWWWAQMNGGGGSAVNPYTGEAPAAAESPWANDGTPVNPYAQLYGTEMSPAESAFWREVYGNANDPNWKPSEEFGTTNDVDGLFSPEGWAAHQKLSADLNQQLRDEYERIARQEAIDYQNNLPAFTAPSTWDYFSAAVEDFGAGMAYGVGNLIDAIADLPQENITGIPDTLALLARGGSWLIGGNGSIAGKLQTFADAVHDFVDPKAQWAKDKLGLSQMIDELGRNYSGSDWAAKTSKVSATVFAIAVDMLVGLGGLAYSKGLKGIVKLGGTLNDATKIVLGMATKKQILAKDILGAIRNLNIENATKGIDADVLRKFAKQDLDDAIRQLDEALDLNRAMSAQRKMEEIREIERKWANIDAQRMRIPAEEARHADDLAAHEAKLAREKAAQEWYDSNILKADREAEAARLANPNADAEARALARENPASLGSQTGQIEKVAGRAEAAAPGNNKAALELARERLDALDDPIAKMEAWQNGTPDSYAAYSREIEAARAEVARLESGLSATGTRELTAAEREVAARAEAAAAAKKNWPTLQEKAEAKYAAQWHLTPEEAHVQFQAAMDRIQPANGVKPATKGSLDDAVSRISDNPFEEAERRIAQITRSDDYSANGRPAELFAEQHPDWVKVENGNGTVHFEKPAAAATKGNLDDAVSRLDVAPTKNEVVGGMYEAASRGGSYTDDAGRLLVDNGQVTAAGERAIKQGAAEVSGAAKGNPWQKLEDAAAQVRLGDAAEDAARATKGALDNAVDHMKPAMAGAKPTADELSAATENLASKVKDPARNLQDYIEATERQAHNIKQWQDIDVERRAALEAKGSLTEAERMEWGALKKTIKARQERLDALERTLNSARSPSVQNYWDEAVAGGKKADAALAEAVTKAQESAKAAARAGMEAARESGAVGSNAGFIDTDLFRVVGKNVKDFFTTPSVQELARESDRIAAGLTQSQATKRLMAATGGLLTLPLIAAGLAKVDQRNMNAGNPYAFGTGTPENTRPTYASDNIPKNEMRRILGDEENTGGTGGGSGGGKNNPAAAERAAAKVEAAERMAAQTENQPPAPEPAPRPERKMVDPSEEEIERARQLAGHGYQMTANDLQRSIDNLVKERDAILAKSYEVPVPEMRPTEYQNIQQVRAAAAAKPGATATSIIAAVNKAQRQNSDVAKLKADIKRALKGARTDKQREKAEQEILREYNQAYFDAIERNAANEKLSAKRLQQIIDRLPRLEASRDAELGKKERAEERAEERVRRETQRKADMEYRDQLSQWRDSERARREAERKQRDDFKKTVSTVRQERRDAETRKKKTWRAALAGDRETFYQWSPDGDWDAAQRIVRAAQKVNQGGYKRGWEREASILGTLYVQDPPLVTDGYEKTLGRAG